MPWWSALFLGNRTKPPTYKFHAIMLYRVHIAMIWNKIALYWLHRKILSTYCTCHSYDDPVSLLATTFCILKRNISQSCSMRLILLRSLLYAKQHSINQLSQQNFEKQM